MKVLITGNLGYIGPVLSKYLRERYPSIYIVGLDTGYFGHCLTTSNVLPEACINEQIYCDVRNFPEKVLEGIDYVVHLAAISNDPMGNTYASATHEINAKSSIDLLKLSIKNGVKNFVFASSCSMYGSGGDGAKKEGDSLNPLTDYARSKVEFEKCLDQLDVGGTIVTSLRFATACGMSPRLRLDLVLNDFVASAISSGVIEVLSDGSPWRPLIAVADMARAIDWALFREVECGGQTLKINIGSEAWNYQVKEIAYAVSRVIDGVAISINDRALPDKRSYKVDFSLFKELAPDHQPLSTLELTINGLYMGLMKLGFRDNSFRSSIYMRLKMLQRHIEEGTLDQDLRWNY